MQTFLPYPDFYDSLSCLDNKRLGKQRVEAYMIIGNLTGYRVNRWINHPAVEMWRNNISALIYYYHMSLLLWEERGYANIKCQPILCDDPIVFPSWLGDNRFHAAHRSNLLLKNRQHYEQFGWTEPNNLAYYWPKP